MMVSSIEPTNPMLVNLHTFCALAYCQKAI